MKPIHLCIVSGESDDQPLEAVIRTVAHKSKIKPLLAGEALQVNAEYGARGKKPAHVLMQTGHHPEKRFVDILNNRLSGNEREYDLIIWDYEPDAEVDGDGNKIPRFDDVHRAFTKDELQLAARSFVQIRLEALDHQKKHPLVSAWNTPRTWDNRTNKDAVRMIHKVAGFDFSFLHGYEYDLHRIRREAELKAAEDDVPICLAVMPKRMYETGGSFYRPASDAYKIGKLARRNKHISRTMIYLNASWLNEQSGKGIVEWLDGFASGYTAPLWRFRL